MDSSPIQLLISKRTLPVVQHLSEPEIVPETFDQGTWGPKFGVKLNAVNLSKLGANCSFP